MQKMKVFSSSSPELLEERINAWLEASLGSGEITHITVVPTPMPFNPHGEPHRPIIVVTVWYQLPD